MNRSKQTHAETYHIVIIIVMGAFSIRNGVAEYIYLYQKGKKAISTWLTLASTKQNKQN